MPQAKHAPSTPQRLLKTARALFADRGFYGVSIANIADEHGLTKQALLHHFPSKEVLYGQVLKDVSEALEGQLAAACLAGETPRTQLKVFFTALAEKPDDTVISIRLIMRELLDNHQRSERATTWYLKPFLTTLVKMVKTVPGWSDAHDAEVLAVVYQLLGSVSYYAVSGPTLQGIFGKSKVSKLQTVFPVRFEALIDAAFDAPPHAPSKI
ncbi:MAG: TetR/AcrR family transcriptional regulator [Pseudomonadota bacterium]